jgi:protein TilB
MKSKETPKNENDEEEFQPKLFAPCGRPYNLNIPKLQFNFRDEPGEYVLDLHVYK